MIEFTVHYWVILGILNLIYLTFQDYLNHMKVDDRKNWFMYGLTFALLAIKPASLIYLLSVMALLIILKIFVERLKIFGEADVSTFGWIILGHALISFHSLVWFFITFSVVTLFYTILKVWVFKYKEPAPFYAVIFLSFIFSVVVNGFL